MAASNIVTPKNATLTLSTLMGTYQFSNPREAALAASTHLGLNGISNQIVQERRGRSYLLIADDGRGVRYTK